MKSFRVAMVLSVISLITNIIGVMLPYWVYVSSFRGVSARGLWHYCDIPTDSEYLGCFYTHRTVPAFIHSVRVLELLGTLFLVAATGCGILRLFVRKGASILTKFAGLFGIFAGAFMILGIFVFAGKFAIDLYEDDFFKLEKTYFRLHAGFGLCTASGITAVAAGVFYFDVYYKEEDFF